MPKTIISGNNITFLNDSNTESGTLNFSNGNFDLNKPVAFGAGIQSTGISTENEGSIEVAGMSDIRLAGITSGEVVIKPTNVVNDYTITLPNTQGISNSILLNDGVGNLSWVEKKNYTPSTETRDGDSGEVPAPLAGQQNNLLSGSGLWITPNPSVIFDLMGTQRFHWNAKMNPNDVSLGVYGDAIYITSDNDYYIRLINGANQKSFVNFNTLSSYNKFKFEVYYKISSINEPTDILWFFANGTQSDSGNESSTQGLCYIIDYYNNNTHIHRSKLMNNTAIVQDYENTGIDDIYNRYIKFTMIKNNNDIIIKQEGDLFGVLEQTYTDNTITTGTRFGCCSRSGGESMIITLKSIKLITLD